MSLSTQCAAAFLSLRYPSYIIPNINSAVARVILVGGGGGGTRAPEARAARGVWGHAPPKNFEIKRLGNAISSVLQELFKIYAYRELFTSYTVSANQCTLRV